MCDNLDTPGEDGASLSSSFAAELARRQDGQQAGAPTQASSVTEEPFTGVREIVVRDGVPTAIPKRPAPPPASTMGDEVADLLVNPQFLAGCVVSLGTLAVFLAIASADSAASI